MLPSLNLRTADLSGPYIATLNNEELNEVLIEAKSPPGLYTWPSLQASRQLVASDTEEPDGFAHSDPWWELAAMPKDGSWPFVIDAPLYRSELEYETRSRLVGLAVTRSMWKWPRVLYVSATDRPNEQTAPYAGVITGSTLANLDRKRVFTQGDFSIATPNPMTVDFHTRPLRFFNTDASWSRTQASGAPRAPPDDWYGNPQLTEDLGDPTPAGPSQKKIAYMCLVGITLTLNEEQFRMCGSMLYDDAIDSPYKSTEAVHSLLKTCPYFLIGPTLTNGLGSEQANEAQVRFDAMQSEFTASDGA